ncbi:hypothetical protein CTEN210_00800 [Chaetoceros tenuissimus]|uniref:Uncharacterized protein n=1 Tax=Chaetoceros tenuissimus TaxID=426638 RepID=A0AAD3GZ38_9STRA|nr:hypothetical protein CTEN210_00800 [Chaetoceros tenuissimus]
MKNEGLYRIQQKQQQQQQNRSRLRLVLRAFIILSLVLLNILFIRDALSSIKSSSRLVNQHEVSTTTVTTKNATTKNATTDTIITNNALNQNDNRPLFIIHVGPPKTGSTTLQCTLESLRDKLEQDNFAYIGRPECIGLDIQRHHKQEFNLFASALVTDFACHQKLQNLTYIQKYKNDNANATNNMDAPALECWRKFIDRVSYYKEQNMNVIFSDEAMASRILGVISYRPNIPYPWDALHTVLGGWDVRFITLHRPLYEYLPSVYNERYKVGPNKQKLCLWYNSGEEGDKCIDQGGRKVPKPFDLENGVVTIAGLMEPSQKLCTFPLDLYEELKRRVSHVKLVDMNHREKDGNDDFITEIICHQIHGAIMTCNSLLETRKNKSDKEESPAIVKQRNPSMPLHYDFIAMEACKRGFIKNSTTLSREYVRNSIRHHHEEVNGLKANDFVLDCPDEKTLQEILDLSLDHERRLRGTDGWGEENKEQFKQAFWKSANEKKKFCTVDAASVVENIEWRSFFEGLTND